MKNVIAVVGMVVVAVALGLWHFVWNDQGEEGPVGDAERSGPAIWDRFVTVDKLDKQAFEVWPGKLECDPWERWGGFSRDKKLLVSNQFIAYDNGDVSDFVESTDGGMAIPAELTARFEWWRGEINDTNATLEGWYTAVTDELKQLSMVGSVSDGVLYLEGTRGPRDCRITATRPE